MQVPKVRRRGRHLALHSSIANVNPGQMLHVWRNVTDGFVYVSLPGGLLPGPYRVLQRGKRHVTDSQPVSILSRHFMPAGGIRTNSQALQRAAL